MNLLVKRHHHDCESIRPDPPDNPGTYRWECPRCTTVWIDNAITSHRNTYPTWWQKMFNVPSRTPAVHHFWTVAGTRPFTWEAADAQEQQP